MARRPGVRAKNGYWYSEAGGVGRYFGRVDVISHAEAMSRLWEALALDASVDRVFGGGRGDDAPGELTPSRRPTPRSASSFVRSQVYSVQVQPHTPTLSTPTLTVSALSDRYLDWLRRHLPAGFTTRANVISDAGARRTAIFSPPPSRVRILMPFKTLSQARATPHCM